jgi:hypothetical protein
MDPLEDPLRTHPFQTGREMSIETYPNRPFGFNDDPDRQFGDGSVLTWTRTRGDGPEPLLTLALLHQQNVNRLGRNTQSSQTLRATSAMLLSTSRCSQPPLELSNVLSDSARAFSGAPESTCTYGGAFRMLQDLTYRIVKFWSS